MAGLATILGSSAFAPQGGAIVAVAERHGVAVLQRHGDRGYTLPHRIEHEANLRSLLEAGCERVLAIGSVGSLRAELPVGSLVCPDDFIALQLALSTRDDPSAHAVPGFDGEWREEVLSAWAEHAAEPLRDGGVYWQTSGPRFETPAEIRLIAPHAHVVGMTLAAECVVAGELGLRYAAICVVDNLANGIGSGPLGLAELEAARHANAERLAAGLDRVLPELVG
jgi:5'-methylthioadenosine phosphorylase